MSNSLSNGWVPVCLGCIGTARIELKQKIYVCFLTVNLLTCSQKTTKISNQKKEILGAEAIIIVNIPRSLLQGFLIIFKIMVAKEFPPEN